MPAKQEIYFFYLGWGHENEIRTKFQVWIWIKMEMLFHMILRPNVMQYLIIFETSLKSQEANGII